MDLEFKNIEGFEGLYQISNYGDVKSLSRVQTYKNGKKNLLKEKIKSFFINNSGYKCVSLYKDGFESKFLIHTLVANAFIPKEEGRNCVNHIDRDKMNNFYLNLERTSTRENMCHKSIGENCSSKFPGVMFVKQSNKWKASIHINKKKKHIGLFITEEEAHDARVKFENDNNIINKYS